MASVSRCGKFYIGSGLAGKYKHTERPFFWTRVEGNLSAVWTFIGYLSRHVYAVCTVDE